MYGCAENNREQCQRVRRYKWYDYVDIRHQIEYNGNLLMLYSRKYFPLAQLKFNRYNKLVR